MRLFSPKSKKLDATLDKQDRQPRIAMLYHFMFPDDVVSAHHFDGLAEDLADMGWFVEALPCNRGCRNEQVTYPASDFNGGVHYKRIWRPRFKQASYFGRLMNSTWMIISWMGLAFRSLEKRPDVVLIGTDPIFAILVAIPIKLIAPKIKVVHWCFDLHPEAAIADSIISPNKFFIRFVKKLMHAAYLRCDLIVDIGSCMRNLLRKYKHKAIEFELTPWALIEPPDRVEPSLGVRQELFGESKLALLYSGNFGQAHSFGEILAVARQLRHRTDISFCFAIRGNKVNQLVQEINSEDINIRVAGFAAIEELELRLAAADIHVTTLRPEYSGVVIPSKFFGSIAIGRPVLFAGSVESAIAKWIKKFKIGWIVNKSNIHETVRLLETLADSSASITDIQKRAHAVYTENFSRNSVTKKWHLILSELL